MSRVLTPCQKIESRVLLKKISQVHLGTIHLCGGLL